MEFPDMEWSVLICHFCPLCSPKQGFGGPTCLACSPSITLRYQCPLLSSKQEKRLDQHLFWGGPEILLEGAFSSTSSSPDTFCNSHIIAQRLPGPKLRHFRQSFFAIFLAPYRSHSGPLGPKSQKSRKKGSRGLSAPGPKKVEKSRKEVEKRVKNNLFSTFFNFFSTFFQPFLALGPGNLFSTFLGFRARRARMTPVRGQEDRKSFSEKLKKAVAVSGEKIQARSRRRGQLSSRHFPRRENA